MFLNQDILLHTSNCGEQKSKGSVITNHLCVELVAFPFFHFEQICLFKIIKYDKKMDGISNHSSWEIVSIDKISIMWHILTHFYCAVFSLLAVYLNSSSPADFGHSEPSWMHSISSSRTGLEGLAFTSICTP